MSEPESEIVKIETLVLMNSWLLILLVSASLIFYPIQEYLFQDNLTAYAIALIIGLVCASIGLYYILKLQIKYKEWIKERKIKAELKEMNH